MGNTCDCCGQEFEKSGYRRQRYCSAACRDEAARQRRRGVFECKNVWCRKQFKKTGPRQLYCSPSCRSRSPEYAEYNRKKQARWRKANPERAREIDRASRERVMKRLKSDPERYEEWKRVRSMMNARLWLDRKIRLAASVFAEEQQ